MLKDIVPIELQEVVVVKDNDISDDAPTEVEVARYPWQVLDAMFNEISC